LIAVISFLIINITDGLYESTLSKTAYSRTRRQA